MNAYRLPRLLSMRSKQCSRSCLSVIQHVVQRSQFGHVRQCQRIPAIGSFLQPSHITCKCFVPRQMKVTNTITYLVTAEQEKFHFQYIVANFFSKIKPLSKEIRFGEENVRSNYYNGRESKIIKFCSSTVQWPVEHRFLKHPLAEYRQFSPSRRKLHTVLGLNNIQIQPGLKRSSR